MAICHCCRCRHRRRRISWPLCVSMMMVIIHKAVIRIHHTPVLTEAIDEKRTEREINDIVFVCPCRSRKS